MSELHRRAVNHTATFLRMAAIEMRQLANDEPGLARQLRDIAEKLEAEASDLAPLNRE